MGHNDVLNRLQNGNLGWADDCAYVSAYFGAADPTAGLAVVDVADPRDPRLVKIWPGTPGARESQVEGNQDSRMVVVMPFPLAYERDFETVRVGAEAVITTAAYPGLVLRGRVAYIDPRVDPQTRTAKVRVQVPNRDGRLRLGMFVAMSFADPGGDRLVVPRSAVQTVGDRRVVFVPFDGDEGRFAQRDVRLGAQIGDGYVVIDDLKAGERVVTEGSFFLRAESLRNAPS